jgi:hypothetical protein
VEKRRILIYLHFQFFLSFFVFLYASTLHKSTNSLFSSTEVEKQKALGTAESEESLRLMIRILVVKLDGKRDGEMKRNLMSE